MPQPFCRRASSVFPLSRLRPRSFAFLAAKVVISSIAHGGKSSTRGVKEHYYADFQEKLPIKAGRRHYLFSKIRSYNIRIYKVHRFIIQTAVMRWQPGNVATLIYKPLRAGRKKEYNYYIIIYEIIVIIKTACHVARLPPASAIDSIRISHR